MRTPRFLAILLVAAALLRAEPATFRTWTDIRQQKVEAAFVRVQSDQVTLELRDGKRVAVPLANLSEADRKWLSDPPAAPAEAAARPAASAEWPRTVALTTTPEVKVVREAPAEKEFIYETEHYQFICDSPLGANLVREFSRIFEATWLVNCQLPFDFKPTPEDGREKFQARIFTYESDYGDAGGPKGSAGVYMRGAKALALPASSLGVKMFGSRVTVDYAHRDYSTLIHEITHQMMNHWLPLLPVWYIEGSAEYVAMTKYDNGRFSFLQEEKQLRARLGGDGKFRMVPLEKLMNIRSRDWLAAVASDEGASGNYASALALTYYFYHIDGDGNGGAIRDWLRALEKLVQSAAPGETPDSLVTKYLLRGRSYEALQQDVQKGLRRAGVNVEFGD